MDKEIKVKLEEIKSILEKILRLFEKYDAEVFDDEEEKREYNNYKPKKWNKS